MKSKLRYSHIVKAAGVYFLALALLSACAAKSRFLTKPKEEPVPQAPSQTQTQTQAQPSATPTPIPTAAPVALPQPVEKNKESAKTYVSDAKVDIIKLQRQIRGDEIVIDAEFDGLNPIQVKLKGKIIRDEKNNQWFSTLVSQDSRRDVIGCVLPSSAKSYDDLLVQIMIQSKGESVGDCKNSKADMYALVGATTSATLYEVVVDEGVFAPDRELAEKIIKEFNLDKRLVLDVVRVQLFNADSRTIRNGIDRIFATTRIPLLKKELVVVRASRNESRSEVSEIISTETGVTNLAKTSEVAGLDLVNADTKVENQSLRIDINLQEKESKNLHILTVKSKKKLDFLRNEIALGAQ